MSLHLPDSGADVQPDGRRMTPSAERNAGPILAVLAEVAPARGRVLELAAGSGLHSARFAGALPGLDWQPSDVTAEHFGSITAWAATSAGRVRPPVVLDATAPGWGQVFGGQDMILLVNLLHLISAPAVATLLGEVAQALAPGGIACLYGPFLRGGHTTSPGDAAFDASLRAQDAAIGYKDLDWITQQLVAGGLAVEVREMPANNVMLLARRP